MLEANIKNQLAGYLGKLQAPIELIASLDDSAAAGQMRELLTDIAALSPKVEVRTDGADARKPSFSVGRAGEPARIRFAGIPMGHEFTSLVLALLQVGGHPPRVSDDTLAQIRALEGEFRFVTYISLSCQNCPEVVQSLNLMALVNPRISHETVDGALFQDEVERLKIMGVPAIYLNGELFGQGRMELEEILAKVDSGAAARAAASIDARAAQFLAPSCPSGSRLRLGCNTERMLRATPRNGSSQGLSARDRRSSPDRWYCRDFSGSGALW